MPYSTIANSGLKADAIIAVLSAFQCARESLRLADRNDPLTMIVSNKLIDLAKAGERGPQHLCELALQAIEAAPD